MNEQYSQLSFINLVPYYIEINPSIKPTRTLTDVLKTDFLSTIGMLRKIYLPYGHVLQINHHLLKEALQRIDDFESLDGEYVNNSPLTDIDILFNLQTLRMREYFLEQEKFKTNNSQIAYDPGSTLWENDIRFATDKQFWKLKTSILEDKNKTVVQWDGASTKAFWLMSTVFHPNITDDLTFKISGADWLTAELFNYYYVYLIKKSRKLQ